MSYESITTGQLITATKLQEFQNGIINVFADASARDSAITVSYTHLRAHET